MSKILNSLIFITIFSLPLYVIRGQVSGIPFTFLEVLILFTFGFWLVKVVIEKDSKSVKNLFTDKRFISVWLFLIAGIISVFVTPDKNAGLGIFKAYIIEPILFFVVLFSTIREQKQLTGVFYSLLISGVLTSIVAISQKITGTNLYAPHEIVQGRITGFFNSANALCLYLIPITIILLSKIIVLVKRKQIEQTKSERGKIFFLMICLVLFLTVIYMTGSSGGMLGAIGSLGLIIFLHLTRVKIKISQDTIKRLIAVGVSLYFVSQILFFTIISRFTPNLTERPLVRVFEDTVVVRLCLWEGTWNMLQDKFVLGTGLSNFPLTYYNYVTCDPELLQYPHNLLLNFWSEMGLLGLLSFGLMVYVYLTNIFYHSSPAVGGVENYRLKGTVGTSRLRSDSASGLRSKNNLEAFAYIKIGLFGILVYYLIHGLVDVPYFKNDLSLMWWIFLGMSFILTSPLPSNRK